MPIRVNTNFLFPFLNSSQGLERDFNNDFLNKQKGMCQKLIAVHSILIPVFGSGMLLPRQYFLLLKQMLL